MAIIIETVTIGNYQYTHTYSDGGYMIHGGSPEGDYAEAYDPIGSGRTYTETDIPIDGESTAEEIVDILMGVSE
jgi:hypothetical protein